jgi:hypothetical protein
MEYKHIFVMVTNVTDMEQNLLLALQVKIRKIKLLMVIFSLVHIVTTTTMSTTGSGMMTTRTTFMTTRPPFMTTASSTMVTTATMTIGMSTTTQQTSFQCYDCSGSDCGREGSTLSMSCPTCMVYRNPTDQSKI